MAGSELVVFWDFENLSARPDQIEHVVSRLRQEALNFKPDARVRVKVFADMRTIPDKKRAALTAAGVDVVDSIFNPRNPKEASDKALIMHSLLWLYENKGGDIALMFVTADTDFTVLINKITENRIEVFLVTKEDRRGLRNAATGFVNWDGLLPPPPPAPPPLAPSPPSAECGAPGPPEQNKKNRKKQKREKPAGSSSSSSSSNSQPHDWVIGFDSRMAPKVIGQYGEHVQSIKQSTNTQIHILYADTVAKGGWSGDVPGFDELAICTIRHGQDGSRPDFKLAVQKIATIAASRKGGRTLKCLVPRQGNLEQWLGQIALETGVALTVETTAHPITKWKKKQFDMVSIELLVNAEEDKYAEVCDLLYRALTPGLPGAGSPLAAARALRRSKRPFQDIIAKGLSWVGSRLSELEPPDLKDLEELYGALECRKRGLDEAQEKSSQEDEEACAIAQAMDVVQQARDAQESGRLDATRTKQLADALATLLPPQAEGPRPEGGADKGAGQGADQGADSSANVGADGVEDVRGERGDDAGEDGGLAGEDSGGMGEDGGDGGGKDSQEEGEEDGGEDGCAEDECADAEGADVQADDPNVLSL